MKEFYTLYNVESLTFLEHSKVMRIYKQTLKNGKLTYAEMEKVIDEYIDYYNNRRIQERIGFKTPVEYRKELIG